MHALKAIPNQRCLCRKGSKRQQREPAGGAANGTGDSPPAKPDVAARLAPLRTTPAAADDKELHKSEAETQAAPSPPEAPPAGSAASDAASALLALVMLLISHHAAVRLLAPQAGAWLAGSFCSLALYALAAVGAVGGHVGEEGAATLAALRAGSVCSEPSGSSPAAPRLGVAVHSWWAAAAAAAALAAPQTSRLAGGLLLAPGLADDSSLRISDAELTLRAMALAALVAGPLFLCLGSAAGAAGGRALRSWAGPAAHPELLLLPLVAAVAAAGLGLGLPAMLVPPRPASTLPPAIAGMALLAAAALTTEPAGPGATSAGEAAAPTGRKKQRRWPGGTRGAAPGDRSRRRQRVLAAVLAAAALAVAAQRAHTPQCAGAPGAPLVALEGGRYSVVMQCETAGGSRLGVIEGTYKGQYRWGGAGQCKAVQVGCRHRGRVPATARAHHALLSIQNLTYCCCLLAVVQVPPAAAGPQRARRRVHRTC